VAVNFWNDGNKTVDFITVDRKASVLTQEGPLDLSVAVVDPSQANTGVIAVSLNRSADSVASVDSAITVLQLRWTIQISVNVNGALGRSFAVKFNLPNATGRPAPPRSLRVVGAQ